MTTRPRGITLPRQQPVSIMALGAVGDGVTDDTAAIQAVLNAYSAVVIPPDKTFIVTQLTLKSGQTILGSGATGVIKQKAGTAQFNSVFYALAKSNITIQNVAIDGNGNNMPAGEHNHGVYLEDCTDCMVVNNFIHDCNGDCVYVSSSTSAVLARRNQVQGNNVWNLGRHGICIAEYGAQGVVVSGNVGRVGTYVTTSTSHGNPIHFELDYTPVAYVGDFVVAYNMCYDRGITFGGNFGNVVVTGNVIRGSAFAVDFGLIAAIGCSDLSITNNTIIGDNTTLTDGIYIQDAGNAGVAAVKNTTITNNIIEKVSGHGISFIGSGTGIPSTGRFIIGFNTIDTIGTGYAKNGISLATPCPDTQILFNTIKTVTNIGIAIQGAQNFQCIGNRVADWVSAYGIYMCTNSAIGVGPGLVSHNVFTHASAGTKIAIRVENEATNNRVTITNNEAVGFSSAVAIGAAATNCTDLNNITGNSALIGSFTLGAVVSTVVNNANVRSGSKIQLVPTNAAAATLMGSAKALYITRTPGTSFTVSTANAVAAAGTETFEYTIQ
jgi:parallel beta-helix repeat protein